MPKGDTYDNITTPADDHEFILFKPGDTKNIRWDALKAAMDVALAAYLEANAIAKGAYLFRENIRSFDAKAGFLLHGASTAALSFGIIGDSYSVNKNRYIGKLNTALKAWLGDAGPGYGGFGQGEGWADATKATRTLSAGWLNSGDFDEDTKWSGKGADNSHVHAVAIGDTITVNILEAVDSATLQFYRQASGGSFRYRWDAGAWVETVSTDGAGLATLELTGLPATATTLEIEVETLGSGLILCGLLLAKNAGGIQVHCLAKSGGVLAQWMGQDGWPANPQWDYAALDFLNLDTLLIMFGPNERSTATTNDLFYSKLETFVDALQARFPLLDIMLVAPMETGQAANMTMKAFADEAMRRMAKAKGCGFISLTDLWGDYADYAYSADGSTRNLFVSDNVHPNITTGGALMTEQIRRYIAETTIGPPPPESLPDPFISDGTLFLFDAANTDSWAGGDPADGDPVVDLAGLGNGQIRDVDGVMVHAGGGFDLDAYKTSGGIERGVLGPASIFADLDAAQEYLIAWYMKLPESGTWPDLTASLFSADADGSGGYYTDGVCPLIVGTDPGNQIAVRRQTDTNAHSGQIAVTLTTVGVFAQVAYWRNAAGCGLRVKTATEVQTATQAKGADNALDISTAVPRFGAHGVWSGQGGGGSPFLTGVRYYRGMVENLATSGRDPVTILDEDWTRTIERGVFS